MMEQGRLLLCLVLLAAAGMAPGTAWPAEPVLSAADQACLGCHGEKGLSVKFQNGETVNAFIDADKTEYEAYYELILARLRQNVSLPGTQQAEAI